ncbi:MAG TPA: hypothetical protein VMD48_00530 [Solirubrobacteraceae bacterium]|nr:hypothetical protein [Solirubrobacteraceae bacterium]
MCLADPDLQDEELLTTGRTDLAQAEGGRAVADPALIEQLFGASASTSRAPVASSTTPHTWKDSYVYKS